jgi:hypothetical protein
MASLGPNVKLTIAARWRARVHDLFVEVLGAAATDAGADLAVYRLGEGTRVGVLYTPDDAALSPEDQRKGAWLEFRVSDPAKTADQLRSLGVERIEYADRDHAYFAIPGGPVFRLAIAS